MSEKILAQRLALGYLLWLNGLSKITNREEIMKLSDLELEILHNVTSGGHTSRVTEDGRTFDRWNVQAWVVWQGRDGIEFGACRYAIKSDMGPGNIYSCSPFPGAWTYVFESDILKVRHPKAL